MRNLVHWVQLLAVVAAACTVIALGTHDGPGAPPEGVSLGEHVYTTTCVSCHGPAGQGRIGPAIGDGVAVTALPSRRAMLDLVESGRAGMPAFGEVLSSGEIGAVVDHVRDQLGRGR